MKRCEICNKLTDNGTKYCQRCGTPFKYDPKVTPFSETRISLIVLVIALVSLIVYNNIPLTLPDPSECSRTSYNRFKRLANDYYDQTKNILRQEVIFTSELSTLASLKNEAKAIPVPQCLEPAKADLVAYLGDVYYMGLYSIWGAYQGAAYSTANAGENWASLDAHLAEVKECLPNCP
jgi:hypothetical protein